MSPADAPSSGRVVLVTGGNRGIGLATATAFADAGHRVAVTYRSQAPDDDRFLCVPCDVADTAQVEAAFEKVESELGPVEVLVANAGMTRDGLVLRMSDDDFADVLDTNLTGAFRCARRAVKQMMRARWGRIVLLSSIVGTAGQAGQANYAASKAGLVGLARSLAREFASRNVTVNVVAPGPIATDMTDALTDDQRAAMGQAVPLGRFGTPDEVAATIRFLASDEAGYITGAVIPVDGGLGMGS
ncbi:3-oxoacyl-[acyl-carrier-protein] reductase [Actinomarinicola tropica]|uniref:3-oxoacyl-[acyl-carrier-protein] reductase n=1 Tax=Actinomarinicola tropica TaxID=2789776 RepID=A0A5Q2RF56_9ACTN|nr:3-oxoacyl-[acyl-carrier-protein] reductase [Actinomarinicola tropica]QGG95488.1 3-oxoacyl-[acyl-carrier-protein] reductase [Actinomarinicola tropica]